MSPSQASEPQPLDPSTAQALAMVERARWAARAFADFDLATVRTIAAAAAQAGAEHAETLARDTVAEAGFGVVQDKVTKNLACSAGMWQAYAESDFVSPQTNAENKTVSVPMPAGVLFALTPSTNPVATTYVKILFALLTRNAIILSPHPATSGVSTRAAEIMSAAAVAAGAPDGVIQWIEQPTVPLVERIMRSPRIDLILATGGTPMVRAAYSSSNPALGVGPGNVPVLVSADADLTRAAEQIVASKSFDNSVLCTNESVLIVQDSVADQLLAAMRRHGAFLMDEAQTAAVRRLIFPQGRLSASWVGRDATKIAAAAGISVPSSTKVLLAPITAVVDEEMLAHEKLLPVLAVVRVPSARRGIDVARAVLRITGAGHSAAIHSRDAATVLAYGAAMPVGRISVNVGNSLGASGFHTHLPPTMTIGTGYAGRSALNGNLTPEHLITRTTLAYAIDPAVSMPDFTGLEVWRRPQGPIPAYPLASNLAGAAHWADEANPGGSAGGLGGLLTGQIPGQGDGPAGAPDIDDELREHLRRLILAELRSMVEV